MIGGTRLVKTKQFDKSKVLYMNNNITFLKEIKRTMCWQIQFLKYKLDEQIEKATVNIPTKISQTRDFYRYKNLSTLHLQVKFRKINT